MPRKIAGSAMMTTDPSSDAMKMAAVVLARAVQAYASGLGGFGRPAGASVAVLAPIRASPPAARAARRRP